MFLPRFLSWLSGLNELWLFFNTWFSASKMIGDFNFIVFQKSLIIKFTAVFRFYPKIRCHSNKSWHWILRVRIRRRRLIKAQYITRSLPTKWNHCHITTDKIRLSCSFLCLLHLPCVMMLIICFYVLIHENVIATVDFNLEFGLLVILDLFINLGVCLIFIILWINQLLLACSLLGLCLLTFQYLFLCFWDQIFLDFNCFVNLFLLLLHVSLGRFGLRVSKNLVFASFNSHRQDF